MNTLDCGRIRTGGSETNWFSAGSQRRRAPMNATIGVFSATVCKEQASVDE
ncbi:MAG: hypothetical protein HGA61_04030 [Candidatus Moranbacteria bacterium]|nr:hypothetical protein [Candidatus Moranbacteria bacterium]